MRRKPLRVDKTKRKCRRSGKIKWRTELDAKLAMANIDYKMRAATKEKEIRAYRCPFCDYWHLTHQEPRQHKEQARDSA